jgi:hypothetical protein
MTPHDITALTYFWHAARRRMNDAAACGRFTVASQWLTLMSEIADELGYTPETESEGTR